MKGQITQTQAKLNFSDTLCFAPLHEWITIDNDNLWEIGLPSKTKFDSAYSGQIALITDSLNYYPNNCNHTFLIKIPYPDYHWGEGILSFYHRFNTDTLVDRGLIEVSYDNGNSWINLLDDHQCIATSFIGMYADTINGSKYGFSGNSNGWQYVEIYWWMDALTGKSASVNNYFRMLRFRFVSDNNNTNKEGWMIDDIVFRGYDISGAIEEKSEEYLKVYPIPAKDVINFQIPNEDYFNFNLILYNMSGAYLRKYNLSNRQIDISDLHSGSYIYEIISDKKLIKRSFFIVL